jgi:TIR domain/Pentapeptide repeats (8 copies)
MGLFFDWRGPMNRGIVARMADPEQLEAISQGVQHWNTYRLGNNEKRIDLTQADLRRTTLKGAWLYDSDLSGANLSGVDLTDANLSNADLNNADLSNANLSEAILIETTFYDANLVRANISGATLENTMLVRADLTQATLNNAVIDGAVLLNAHLSGANLSGAKLYEVTFANCDLTNARGLDSCVHNGPSTIDHRTLIKSGQLPLSFLRGCGLPETLITYLPSILNQPIEFYSVFISYSTRDQDFADRLYADLQNKGVRCWFAPRDMRSIKRIHEQIDEAIRVYDRLLLVLSESSMQSNWVEREILGAFRKQREQKKHVLFPIGLAPFSAIKEWECFDSDTGRDLARDIRSYYILDFTDWKQHDQYLTAFGRLMRDLKSDPAMEPEGADST